MVPKDRTGFNHIMKNTGCVALQVASGSKKELLNVFFSAGLDTFRYFFEMNFAFEKSQTLQNMLKPRVKASAK